MPDEDQEQPVQRLGASTDLAQDSEEVVPCRLVRDHIRRVLGAFAQIDDVLRWDAVPLCERGLQRDGLIVKAASVFGVASQSNDDDRVRGPLSLHADG